MAGSAQARNRLGGAISWFPGHMVQATRDIKERLRPVDLIVEVRDARIPLSSANEQLEEMVRHKRRLVVLNKMELANRNLEQRWGSYFAEQDQRHIFASARHPKSVSRLLTLVRDWLAEERGAQPTLLVMVVGVPNVGKSALINAMHRQGLPHLAVQGEQKRAKEGPLPGVTRQVAGFKIGDRPSTYILDTPGVMVPRVSTTEVGLKLALTGSVKDSVVGEERLARYLLASLTLRRAAQGRLTRGRAHLGEAAGDARGRTLSQHHERAGLEGHVMEALALPWEEEEAIPTERHLEETLVRAQIDGADRSDPARATDTMEAMDAHVDRQMAMLRRRFGIPAENGDAGWNLVGRHLLRLYRSGALGCFTLDMVPHTTMQDSKS